MRLRKVSQHNTPPGSGVADCHLKKPIRLNHLVELTTRAKMVVDIILIAKYPLPPKPEISTPH